MAVAIDRRSVNAVDSEVRGPRPGVERRGLLCTTGRQAQTVRRHRSRRSVGTVDSDERGPTAGVAGSCLSGTACRLARRVGAGTAGVRLAGSTS